VFLPSSRGRRGRKRAINLLQRGCDRGAEWGNTSPSCAFNPVDCKIRPLRLSDRKGSGVRWGRGKERVIIIERDLCGSYNLVRWVERHKVKSGKLVL